MEFIGREKELEVFRQAFASNRSELIVLYGRRRIGKSELIQQAVGKDGGIYLVGKTTRAPMQRRELLREAARVLREPLLAEHSGEEWKSVLERIVGAAPRGGKLVLALDEFQWLVEASPELPSVLQELWDRQWKRAGNVVLILCGSYVGFMEREVLGKQSPLFGRRTAQILLQPFGYRDAARFHPSWSRDDQARAYFICGGVPFYLRELTEERSLEQNIQDRILGEHSPLFREPDFLLREELRDVESYYAVLTAIAEGQRSQAAITKRAELGRSLAYYLKQLEQLGYIERARPLTRARANPRQTRYLLKDPFLRFWFRFVFPNLSYLQQMGGASTLRERIRPELPSFYGAPFEGLCREALPLLLRREGLSVAVDVGQYWSPEVQVDVVGLRDDGWVELGECKWGELRSLRGVADDLEAKVARYPARSGDTIHRRLFVRKGSGKGVPGVTCHSLQELYEG